LFLFYLYDEIDLTMAISKGTLRTCKKGHKYYKSTDCPVCPVCAAEEKPVDGFLSVVGAPARRALLGQGINTIQQLAKWSKKDLLKLHGFGPSAIPKLLVELKKNGLSFKD
jgi:predicted RecB family nuclease